MVRFSLVLFITLLFTLMSLGANASSCCGQSGGSFPVSYLNQQIALNFSLSESIVLGRVRAGSDQFITFSEDKKIVKDSLRFESVYSLQSRHQLFTKASFFRNSYQSSLLNQKKTDFSDILLGYTFELLPEYTYSKWKPVVYISGILNVPTGRSVHNPGGLAEGVDVTGYDQWGLGLGLTTRKVWFPFRVIVQLKTLVLFPVKLSGIELSSFFENSASFTFGYSFPSFYSLNLTSGLSFQTLDRRRVDSNKPDDSEFVSFNFSIIKPVNELLAFSLNFVDQTLFGTPENTLLSRAFSLSISYNFF